MLQYTTPTALMAFSQTCRRFRHLTQPDRYHFMQRLLELELITEYGGGVPSINRFGVVKPSLYDEAHWRDIRYACSGCLKLRSHRVFANSAILSLHFRKPEPHMLAAGMLAEPGNIRERTIRHIRAKGTRRDQMRKENRLRREIGERITNSSPTSVHVPRRDASDLQIQQYDDMLSRNAGKQRYKRLCADCVLSRGRHQGFADAYLNPKPAVAFPIEFHSFGPARDFMYYYFVPVISTRWYTDFAPSSQSVAKDHIKSMGRKAAKCTVCGHWRALLSFVQDSPGDFCVVTTNTIGPNDERRCVCWECRHRTQIRRGEVVQKTLFTTMDTRAVS